MSDDMPAGFSDDFNRASLGAEWDCPGLQMPDVAADGPSSFRCLTCGNVVTPQPGESISYDDPRVCVHFSAPGLGG